MPDTPSIDVLTDRQKEILRLMGRHVRRKQVARILNISPATVAAHTDQARKRLGVQTSLEAVELVLRHDAQSLDQNDYRPTKPLSKQPVDEPSSGHEHALSTKTTTPHSEVFRSGTGPSNAGDTGKAAVYSRDDRYAANAQFRRGDESRLYDGVSGSVADGRQRGFIERLARLSPLKWLVLIVSISMSSIVLVVFGVGAMESGLEVVKRLLHYLGW